MKYHKSVCSLLYFALVFGGASAVSAVEMTNKQKISRIQYNGISNTLFFIGESVWTTGNCPPATYIQVEGGDVQGIKEIMSIGLSAKMANIDVSFWGNCGTDADYFQGFYVVIE